MPLPAVPVAGQVSGIDDVLRRDAVPDLQNARVELCILHCDRAASQVRAKLLLQHLQVAGDFIRARLEVGNRGFEDGGALVELTAVFR